ncbi:MAG TPA: quinone-dependent dihydroorotate dehydrogenase [Zeimonas sp.]|nr:quinone-dependent dihydroorotate dehydrogenase [Zeimonas sp.]
MIPYAVARPLLFALDPETAHELTLRALDGAGRFGGVQVLAGCPVDDPVEVMGLRFRNRVGLAAGLDKNAAHVDALAALGFGFLEVGTVTPRPQPGNPRPRLFRVPQREALINRMGFNNDGVDALVANLARARYRGVLGVNIGKNADTPLERAVDDYLFCLERVYAHASYVTVNVSSPNTAKLRELQSRDALDELLDALRAKRDELARRHGRVVPLALKIAPDLDDAQIEAIAALLLRHGIEAVIATNTTVSREKVTGLPNATQSGGLSGAPVFEASNRVVRALRAALPRGYPIIGVGGILCADDARAKLVAGATLVQLYTGLIYRGPGLVGQCARALRDAMRNAEPVAAGEA